MQLPKQIRNITPAALGEWAFIVSNFTASYLALRGGIDIPNITSVYIARIQELIKAVVPLAAVPAPNLTGFASEVTGDINTAYNNPTAGNLWKSTPASYAARKTGITSAQKLWETSPAGFLIKKARGK